MYVSLSSVRHPSKLIKLLVGLVGALIYKWLEGAQVTSYYMQQTSEGGQPCGTVLNL